MKKQGYITAEEYTAGVTTPPLPPATLNVHPLRQGCMTAGDVVAGAGYFCDYVTKVIVNDPPAFGPTPDDRKAVLYRGGLIITTTLDPRLQTIADAEVKASIPRRRHVRRRRRARDGPAGHGQDPRDGAEPELHAGRGEPR